MGQNQSLSDSLSEVESLQVQMKRQAQVLSEMRSLSYESFKACLKQLNTLSRRCIDPNGRQLIFLVKPGTDKSLLWKATVRIACVRVEPQLRQIEACKFLNLKQFMAVFKTFQTHLQTLVSSEQQRSAQMAGSRSDSLEMSTASPGIAPLHSGELIQNVWDNCSWASCNSSLSLSLSSDAEDGGKAPVLLGDECSICMDRKNDLTLPCMHSFCTPCIEQWNVNSKTCPICCDDLKSLDEAWVLSMLPAVEEVNEHICSDLMDLVKDLKSKP